MAETSTQTVDTTTTTDGTTEATGTETGAVDESAEIRRLKAELTKANNKNDSLSKEAADYKKQLRAKQTAEEQKAEEEAEKWAAIQRERDELLKEKTIATTSKKVFTFVQDEETATSIAAFLYGAEDAEAALDAINKAWGAREKKIRAELMGQTPKPGGSGAVAPTTTKAQLDAMSYTERVNFAREYPDEYDALMGRNN